MSRETILALLFELFYNIIEMLLQCYANGKGGVIFVGVSNDSEAFGIEFDEIDKTQNLIARINDRYIFPHVRIRYMMRSVGCKCRKICFSCERTLATPEDIKVLWQRF